MFVDVDECCLGGYCHTYANCTNMPGSFLCVCNPGFTGNGTYCEGMSIVVKAAFPIVFNYFTNSAE